MSTPVVPRNLAGRYDIKQVLGQGDVGVVYRAYDTLAGADVALKLLNAFPDAVTLQLFKKDCAILSLLKHPNFLEILDIGEIEEAGARKLFFATPLLPSTSLLALMQIASHRLTVERTIQILSDGCRALQTAHERDLVHGDLKPSNIFLLDDESVKVTDFGISRLGSTAADSKRNPFYLSPEQAQNKPLSPASDIFSLSVIGYEALTGRQAFRRVKEEEVIAAILTRTPPLASELNSQVNETIARVLRTAMAKQPGDRFASAREFANALDKAVRNQPVEVTDPPESIRSRAFEPEIRVRVKEEANTSLAFDNLFRSFDKRPSTDPQVAPPGPEPKLPVEPAAQPTSPALSRMREGQRLGSQKQFAEGLKLLRQACQLDPNDSTTSVALCDGLIEYARSIVDNDWKNAEELVQEALEVNPGHAGARSMRTVVLERKKQYAIDQCLLQAVSMQAAGNIAGALARVDETLLTYMHDTRLAQMRDSLQKELLAQRQQRAQQIEPKPITPVPPAVVKPPVVVQRPVVEPPAAVELPIAAEPPESPSATKLFSSASVTPTPTPPLDLSDAIAPPRPAGRTTTRVVRANEPIKAPATQRAVASPKGASPQQRSFAQRLSFPKLNLGVLPKNAIALGAAALFVVLLAVLVFVKMVYRSHPQTAAVSALVFRVHTSPSGATVLVNGETRGISDLDLNLTSGHYQIEARLDGYEPASTSFDAQPGTSNAIELTLQPAPPAVKLVSDIASGNVSLDDQPASDLEGAQWSSQSLSAGDHKLTFNAPQSQVSFTFSTASAQPSIKSVWRREVWRRWW
jgi:serine/threonine protein kinase